MSARVSLAPGVVLACTLALSGCTAASETASVYESQGAPRAAVNAGAVSSGGDGAGAGAGAGVAVANEPQRPAVVARDPNAPGGHRENPVMRCGPRESYQYVASEFRCADGTNPLNGNARAGAMARQGNVGANSTGHIIDVYVVPCPEGPQQVYVDMYGCDGAGGGAAGQPAQPAPY